MDFAVGAQLAIPYDEKFKLALPLDSDLISLRSFVSILKVCINRLLCY